MENKELLATALRVNGIELDADWIAGMLEGYVTVFDIAELDSTFVHKYEIRDGRLTSLHLTGKKMVFVYKDHFSVC